jgi:ThiF family
VGQHKCDSATRTVRALNSSIRVETYGEGLTPENAVDIVGRYDVVVDASDNAPTRYLIRCWVVLVLDLGCRVRLRLLLHCGWHVLRSAMHVLTLD